MKIYGNILQANILSKILSPGQTVNLGITLAAGVLSVCASDGSALSATNPGFACVQSITAGKNVVIAFTANQTIQDKNHASPQILGRLGTTASVAWSNVMPIFLGVINRDDTSANAKITLGRNPLPHFDSGASTNIGKAGTAAGTSSQNNIIIADSSVTVADYANKPVTSIGSVRMIIDNSAGGSATINALYEDYDGIGNFQEGVVFSYPQNQNGAAVGSHLKLNGGTSVPAFTTNQFFYTISKNGTIQILSRLNGDAGTDGVGAVLAIITLPYINSSAAEIAPFIGTVTYSGASYSIAGQVDLVNPSMSIYKFPSFASVLLVDFVNGARSIEIKFDFKAF